MKITRLSTAVIEANYDWTLVRLDAEGGLCGLGEAYMGPGLTAILREMASLVVGRDALQPEVLVRRLRASTVHAAPGVVYHAIAGIEMALLDLLGKSCGQPVWRLLGGKFRDKIRVYADCHGGEALESLSALLVPGRRVGCRPKRKDGSRRSASGITGGMQRGRPNRLRKLYRRQAEEMVGRGFSALKFDVDVPTPYQTDEYNRSLSRGEIEYMASLVRAVREAVGPQVSLAVDCHWNYAVQDAVELARSVEPYDLSWLEDPIPPEHLERIAEVQRHTRTPIAAGENYYYRVQFARLLAPGGLRVLTPDPLKLGLWETKKTAALADASYANLALHNISGPVGTMACAHLAAAIPNFLLLEWHAASVPFFDELLNRYRKPEEGFFE